MASEMLVYVVGAVIVVGAVVGVALEAYHRPLSELPTQRMVLLASLIVLAVLAMAFSRILTTLS